jgi:hypothetical protein
MSESLRSRNKRLEHQLSEERAASEKLAIKLKSAEKQNQIYSDIVNQLRKNLKDDEIKYDRLIEEMSKDDGLKECVQKADLNTPSSETLSKSVSVDTLSAVEEYPVIEVAEPIVTLLNRRILMTRMQLLHDARH